MQLDCTKQRHTTELAAASLYMAVNETHYSQIHTTLTSWLYEIHNLLMMFSVRVIRRVRQRGLGRLNSNLACHFLLNLQARIFQLVHLLVKFQTGSNLALSRVRSRSDVHYVVSLTVFVLSSGSLVERSENEVRGCWSFDGFGGHSSDSRSQWYALS